MLNDGDVQLIKNMLAELKQKRTTPVTLERLTVTGADPYTGEPVTSKTTDTVQAIVKYAVDATGTNESNLILGVKVEQGDLLVRFDFGENLTNVDSLGYNGKRYKLISVTPKGIGGFNRYECIARRVT